jgi:hypothetical protein
MSLPLPPPARAESPLDPAAWEPEEQVAPRRPGRPAAPRPSRRGLRRIATAVALALLVAGVGASITLGWRTPVEAWTGIRQKPLAETWAALRSHSFSQTWSAVRRHASSAWIAVRRHTPFDEPDAEASASVAPSPAGIREASAIARGTHRRTKAHPAKRRGD